MSDHRPVVALIQIKSVVVNEAAKDLIREDVLNKLSLTKATIAIQPVSTNASVAKIVCSRQFLLFPLFRTLMFANVSSNVTFSMLLG